MAEEQQGTFEALKNTSIYNPMLLFMKSVAFIMIHEGRGDKSHSETYADESLILVSLIKALIWL